MREYREVTLLDSYLMNLGILHHHGSMMGFRKALQLKLTNQLLSKMKIVIKILIIIVIISLISITKKNIIITIIAIMIMIIVIHRESHFFP